MKGCGLGYLVVFKVGDTELTVGEGYGLTMETAERMKEDLERQGITAIVNNNEWMQTE